MAKNEDFFQVIGHISVFFATLDLLTTMLITELNKSVVRSKIKNQTTLTQKFRILENYKEDEVVNIQVLKSLQEFLPEAIEVSKKRNRFIHDQWIFEPEKIENGLIERAILNGLDNNKVQFKRVNHTLDDLYGLLNEIGSIQKKIGALLDILKIVSIA